MSRRKQAHPSRHLEDEGLAGPTTTASTSTLPNGESSCSASDDDGGGTESGGAQDGGISDSGSRLHPMQQQTSEERSCSSCRGEFPSLAVFLAHKVSCGGKLLHHHPAPQDEDMASSEEDEEVKRVGGEIRRRRLQDAQNNNGALGHAHEKDEFEDYEETAKSMASVMNLAPLLNLSPGVPPNPAAAAAMAAAAAALPGAASLFPALGGSTVTLEALQNTKVAVAQFAATALANNANNPAALQELAVLQSTLYTLQHQQMLQLNLIQQLQQQLQISRGSKEGSPVSPASIPRMQQDDILTPPSPPISIPSSLPISSANIPLQHHPPHSLERPPESSRLEPRSEPRHELRHEPLRLEPRHVDIRHERPIPPERQQTPLTPTQERQQGTAVPATVLKQPQVTSSLSTPRLSLGVEPLPPSKPAPSTTPRLPSPPCTTSCTPVSVAPSIPTSAPLNIPPHPLHHQTGGGVTGCSISASLAASIITNTDPLPNSDEPNSLEMLQRRAQEVLDSASQGLLAGNLADELAFRGGAGGKGGSGKSGDGKRGNEPFFKHRCRYCGKVFGSDSALQIHIRSHTVRGNTTCNICFKTFACNSALEIHYRSHTKERPFKCSICDRGFSTKGNMKQHMLTHKIRDMPQHLFDAAQKQKQQQQQQQQPQMIPRQGTPPSLTPKTSPLPLLPPPMQQHCSNSNSEDGMSNAGDEKPPTTPTPEPHSGGARTPELGQKRSPPDDDSLLPIPKRPPGLPKHLCHVCNKNFSSSSALQIHMRTHTGDKPFKCTVCQKAFTTKGNLKVHMGTHMWNNGASRRGRRMSLDLPPIPMTPKDSEFLQRRPDLFYPYLPAPFLNGMQQKLNEISVIQSANSTGGLPSPPSKFGHPLGFAGLGLGYDKPLGLTMSAGNDLSRSGSPSPDSGSKHGPSSPLSLVRHTSPPCHSAPPNMWDLHYRRLSPPERNGASSPPPTSQQSMMSLTPSPPANPVQHPPPGTTPPQQLTTQRGESLVA